MELLWRWSDRIDIRASADELPTGPGAGYAWTTRWTPVNAQGDRLTAAFTYRLRTWGDLGRARTYCLLRAGLTISAQEDEAECSGTEQGRGRSPARTAGAGAV